MGYSTAPPGVFIAGNVLPLPSRSPCPSRGKSWSWCSDTGAQNNHVPPCVCRPCRRPPRLSWQWATSGRGRRSASTTATGGNGSRHTRHRTVRGGSRNRSSHRLGGRVQDVRAHGLPAAPKTTELPDHRHSGKRTGPASGVLPIFEFWLTFDNTHAAATRSKRWLQHSGARDPNRVVASPFVGHASESG